MRGKNEVKNFDFLSPGQQGNCLFRETWLYETCKVYRISLVCIALQDLTKEYCFQKCNFLMYFPEFLRYCMQTTVVKGSPVSCWNSFIYTWIVISSHIYGCIHLFIFSWTFKTNTKLLKY